MNGNYYVQAWIAGRPADFWFQHSEAIESFVRERKLEPVAQETLSFRMMQPAVRHQAALGRAATMEEPLPWPPQPFPGGIRVAHLHLGDQVYKLSAEQWRDFSGSILKDFSAKLAAAQSVSFPRFLDLSSVIDTMA